MSDYVNFIYDMVSRECKGVDAIYEDYIIYLVGVKGLNMLRKHNLIETCGVMHNKQLYTLLEMKGD